MQQTRYGNWQRTVRIATQWVPPLVGAFVLLLTLGLRPTALVVGAGMLAGMPVVGWIRRRGTSGARNGNGNGAGRDQMLSFMAHELRTPLTAVVGMADLLRDSQLSADQREMVDVIGRSAKGLVEIVTDVLDLAKLEAGKLHVDHRPFDVAACVEECIDLLAARAVEKQIELAYIVNENVPPQVRGDGTRVRQVLINLVGNALKFTQVGEVVVSVSRSALPNGSCEVHVAVADTGPGIPPERLEAIFEDYAQGDASTTRRFGGTGLGLSISRRLVTLMGGRMWVESEVGEGSTFHFTIRGEPVSAPQPHGERLGGPLAGRRVLVVDDSDTVCYLLSSVLQRWGVEVRTASDPQEAIGHLRSERPFHLALIDSTLPGMEGRSLASAIRRHPAANGISLVLLTSLNGRRPDDEAILNGAEGRFAGYITKPVKPARLYDTLVRALANGNGSRHAVPSAPEPAITCPSATATQATDATAGADDLTGLRILIADDDPDAREVLEIAMETEGADVTSVAHGALALDVLRKWQADIVLLDGVMPKLDGFEACRKLKADPKTMLIPVIMISGLDSGADGMRAVEAGADAFLRKPFNRAELVARIRTLARLKRFTDGLERAEAVLVAMARCIEGKDPHTHGHCERLSEFATRLGERIGLDGEALDALRLGGIVHDIGKVSIPDAILFKPGPLDDAEWHVMRNHPLEGERICAGLSSFRHVLPIIRHHHERLDGTGYPDGLRGEAIPVTARVLQIVDVYDALTTERPYKPAVSSERALAIMADEVERGWWDPEIFAAFRELVHDELDVRRNAVARAG